MNRHRYDDDLLAWTAEQAALLRSGDVSALDLENLAEEIESVGKSERRELDSRLVVLLHHLLKYRFQPDQRSPSWRGTIKEQRRGLDKLLADSPSLRRLVPDMLRPAYAEVLEDATEETGLSRLPTACPFTVEQILKRDWLPD